MSQYKEWITILQQLDATSADRKQVDALVILETTILGSRLSGSAEQKVKKLIRDSRKVRPINLEDRAKEINNLKIFCCTNVYRELEILNRKSEVKEMISQDFSEAEKEDRPGSLPMHESSLSFFVSKKLPSTSSSSAATSVDETTHPHSQSNRVGGRVRREPSSTMFL